MVIRILVNNFLAGMKVQTMLPSVTEEKLSIKTDIQIQTNSESAGLCDNKNNNSSKC